MRPAEKRKQGARKAERDFFQRPFYRRRPHARFPSSEQPEINLPRLTGTGAMPHGIASAFPDAEKAAR